MRYRNIPGTTLNPSALCLGTAHFGSSIDEKDCFELLDTFINEGGNFIDTAHVYGNWAPGCNGASEKVIGRWLAARRNRDRIIIATKGAHPELSTMHIPRLSRQEIMADLDESLQYLQTDYIDLYWLHRDDPSRPVDDILQTLNEQVKAGKIRYFGCSNWTVPRISEAMEYAKHHRLKGFIADQMMWSLAVPNVDVIQDKTLVPMDDKIMELHRNTHLAAIPYSSQAQGFFTKLVDAKGDIGRLKEDVRNLYYNDTNISRLQKVQRLAEDLNRTVTEIALAYLISQPFVTVPIIGCRTVSQLTQSLKAGDLLLDEDMVAYLEG